MDEIVIEEKEYISTKRAAKATGYAKDYVGQLCREGRVPARLVGRSWYVLESALADHRFGNEGESVKAAKGSKTQQSEYPKYHADEVEVIDIVPSKSIEVPEEGVKPERKTVQDAWEAWFDRVAAATAPMSSAKDQTEPAEEQEDVKEEVQVSINTTESAALGTGEAKASLKEEEGSDAEEPVLHVHRSYKTNVPMERVNIESSSITSSRDGASGIMAAKIGGAIIAVLVVVIFALGTGIFDRYIISAGRDAVFAGISIYTK